MAPDVGTPNRIAPGPESEHEYAPQPGWIICAIHERVLPIAGYVPHTNRTRGDIIRRSRLGV